MKLFLTIALLFSGIAFATSSAQLKMEKYDNGVAQLKIGIGGDIAKSFFDLLKKAHAANPERVTKADNSETYTIDNIYAFTMPPFEKSALLWVNLDQAEWFNGWMMTSQQGRLFPNSAGYAPHSESLNVMGKTGKAISEVLTLAGIPGQTKHGVLTQRVTEGTTTVHCRTIKTNVSCTLEDSFKP